MTAALKLSVSHDSRVNSVVKMASRESRSFTLIHPSASASGLYGNVLVVCPAAANVASSASEVSKCLICSVLAQPRAAVQPKELVKAPPIRREVIRIRIKSCRSLKIEMEPRRIESSTSIPFSVINLNVVIR